MKNYYVIDFFIKVYNECDNYSFKYYILWALSNLVAGDDYHIMNFLQSELYLKLRYNLEKETNGVVLEITLRIFYLIINEDRPEISIKILDCYFIECLINILNRNLQNNTNIIIYIVEIINQGLIIEKSKKAFEIKFELFSFIEKIGGIDIMENLLYIDNEKINESISRLIKNFNI